MKNYNYLFYKMELMLAMKMQTLIYFVKINQKEILLKV